MGIEYNGIDYQTPNDYYRELAQAFIDDSWENSAARAPENGGPIYEQDLIGTDSYHPIEAWVKNTVGDVTSGMKDSHDFLRLYFKSIDHVATRGLMYRFNDSYWIVNDNNHFSGLAQDVGVRRCNNFLKIVDPENGSIFSIPCVVDYDMQSPSISVNRYVLTPNSHATVMVQGNKDTLRLFKLNTRYILGGRPFKLNAYQNALNLDLDTNYDTLIYLDLYLDEVHEKDDMVQQVADNGDFVYEIVIDSDDMTLINGDAGNLTATVTLNGLEVNRNIVWSSNNSRVVNVGVNGNFTVNGDVRNYAIITATLKGNNNVSASVRITVGNAEEVVPSIVLEPEFNKIRQYENKQFNVGVQYAGHEQMPESVNIEILEGKDCVSYEIKDNYVTLTCTSILNKYVTMRVIATVPGFGQVTKDYVIRTVSMFG